MYFYILWDTTYILFIIKPYKLYIKIKYMKNKCVVIIFIIICIIIIYLCFIYIFYFSYFITSS